MSPAFITGTHRNTLIAGILGSWADWWGAPTGAGEAPQESTWGTISVTQPRGVWEGLGLLCRGQGETGAREGASHREGKVY